MTIRERFAGQNWAGNYKYGAEKLHRPTTLEELQETVAAASSVRVLGSRHSFSDIADSGELVTLEALPADVVVDRGANTVSFNAGMTYGELAERLNVEGLALHNLASLPHISVAGAAATGSHGSGDENGSLATAVAGIELVRSDGEVVEVGRGEPDFNGMVVNLGALGVVTRISLDVEPAYEVRQRVFEGMGWEALLAHFDEITSRGYSVSVWTRWDEPVDQVWVKSRVSDGPERVEDDLFGAVAATGDRHPIPGLDVTNCTPQMGVPGLWSDRLPHFRMGFTPSSGEELQSEYLVPRRHAADAIDAVRGLAGEIEPVLQMSEIRTVAADRLWMSMGYGEDVVGLHFTWKRDQEKVEAVLAVLETALAPFEARPHWGKVFNMEAEEISPLYERMPDFVRLVERLDPRGAFRNAWSETNVLGLY